MRDSMTDEFVATAASLAPLITAASEEGDAMRCTPRRVVEALANAGLLQMFLPRAIGGPELPPLVAFRAIEEVSKSDGSVGWCTMIATVLSLFTGWLDADIARSMVGTPADLRAAGSLRPQGEAREIKGGYQVSGRWNFASGVTYADWLYCTCRVMDGSAPRMTAAGVPLTRAAWVPASAARIDDTWSVVGLRGTGSHDFIVDNIFVDTFIDLAVRSSTSSPLPLRDRSAVLTHGMHKAVRAVDLVFRSRQFRPRRARRPGRRSEWLRLPRRVTPARPRQDLNPPISALRVIANVKHKDSSKPSASAKSSTAREVIEQGHQSTAYDGSDPSLAIAKARLAIERGQLYNPRKFFVTLWVVTAANALGIARGAIHAAGTNAIYTSNPLERHFRDIHVVVQHNAAFAVHYESAGKVLLGLRPTDPGW
jgi:indole-3-acetate monooxygenase